MIKFQSLKRTSSSISLTSSSTSSSLLFDDERAKSVDTCVARKCLKQDEPTFQYQVYTSKSENCLHRIDTSCEHDNSTKCSNSNRLLQFVDINLLRQQNNKQQQQKKKKNSFLDIQHFSHKASTKEIVDSKSTIDMLNRIQHENAIPLSTLSLNKKQYYKSYESNTNMIMTGNAMKNNENFKLQSISKEIITGINKNKSSWDMICKLINCKAAFKKQFQGQKYTWVQLAGHAGSFKPGHRDGYILKLMDDLERQSFERLKNDILCSYVPRIDRIIFDNQDGNYYTEMQDLLYSFHAPCIMDIKIGVRTFIVDDTNEKETLPRHDLYLKLKKLAPDELTSEENEREAITKRRYMSWREKSTCSASLGFRIEAIKKKQVSEKDFYSINEKRDVQAHIENFVNNKSSILIAYLNRLLKLRETLVKSPFFNSHELIGSSLLFVHDDNKSNIWMIDFGKTRPLPDGVEITHNEHWIEGTYEDGYLIGIDSLIDIFKDSIRTTRAMVTVSDR